MCILSEGYVSIIDGSDDRRNDKVIAAYKGSSTNWIRSMQDRGEARKTNLHRVREPGKPHRAYVSPPPYDNSSQLRLAHGCVLVVQGRRDKQGRLTPHRDAYHLLPPVLDRTDGLPDPTGSRPHLDDVSETIVLQMRLAGERPEGPRGKVVDAVVDKWKSDFEFDAHDDGRSPARPQLVSNRNCRNSLARDPSWKTLPMDACLPPRGPHPSSQMGR